MAIKNDAYEYQENFSEMHKEAMYNLAQRTQKANKTIAVIKDYLQKNNLLQKDLSLLDIGCSTGYLTTTYSSVFTNVTGLDIDEKAIQHAQCENSSEHIKFQVGDSMNINFPENSFDAITCTHIYEHVPNSTQLLKEIYRVLKPGGFCYFAAGNRFKIMEDHYRLPMLSVIPKWMANYYIRLCGKSDAYYETHLSLWGLKTLTKNFEIEDYTLEILRDPVKYSATEMITPKSLKQKMYLFILKFAYWLCPTYIWILKKPT